MNDIHELKQFALLHAPGRGIPAGRCRQLLRRIRTDDRGLPGSWVWEWRRAGELLEQRGCLLAASRHYDMARFPYVNGGARDYAQQRGLSTFDRWRRARPGIQPLNFEHAGSQVPCWASGLSAADPRPLLLVMDGIVTTKERWAPLLTRVRRMGMAGVVTEMPGVGENTLRYDGESWRMLPALLDRVSGLAEVGQAYALMPSLGGHLALRCAVEDARIRGIITADAPVSSFFTDARWHQALPRFTLDTLTHLSGSAPGSLPGALGSCALSRAQLAALDIPVFYLASRRDEIVPRSDVARLREHVPGLRLVVTDDVHGSPRHASEAWLWAALSVLQMRGVKGVRRAAVGSLWRALRARHLLAGPAHPAGA